MLYNVFIIGVKTMGSFIIMMCVVLIIGLIANHIADKVTAKYRKKKYERFDAHIEDYVEGDDFWAHAEGQMAGTGNARELD